jgi:hypothetical protein
MRRGGVAFRRACVLAGRTQWRRSRETAGNLIELSFTSAFKRVERAMKVERKEFIAVIGGPDAVMAMDDKARAEALENYLAKKLDAQVDAQASAPTAAELEEKIETRSFGRGVGSLFAVGGSTSLEQAAKKLKDFFAACSKT